MRPLLKTRHHLRSTTGNFNAARPAHDGKRNPDTLNFRLRVAAHWLRYRIQTRDQTHSTPQSTDRLAQAGDLHQYNAELHAFKQITNAHTHSMLFPTVLILCALAIPRMNLADLYIAALGAASIGSTVIWTIGGLMNLKPLKGLGDVLLVVSLILAIAGLYQNF